MKNIIIAAIACGVIALTSCSETISVYQAANSSHHCGQHL